MNKCLMHIFIFFVVLNTKSVEHLMSLNDLNHQLILLESSHKEIDSLKIFQRRTGKLTPNGVDLFNLIIDSIKLIENHNQSLEKNEVKNISQDDFWNEDDQDAKYLKEITSLDFKPYLSDINSKKIINIISGELTNFGRLLFLDIYLNISKLLYFFKSEILEHYSKVNKDTSSVQSIIYFPLNCNVRVSKFVKGTLAYESSAFIKETLANLILIYKSYLNCFKK